MGVIWMQLQIVCVDDGIWIQIKLNFMHFDID